MALFLIAGVFLFFQNNSPPESTVRATRCLWRRGGDETIGRAHAGARTACRRRTVKAARTLALGIAPGV
jgi:hypothetical protein